MSLSLAHNMLLSAFSFALVITTPMGMASAQDGQPPLALDCLMRYVGSDGQPREEVASIMIEQPFSLTNKDMRLKFYRSTLSLETSGQSIPVEGVSRERIVEYPDYRDRWNDQDKPTLFVLDGVEYESFSPTPYKIVAHREGGGVEVSPPDRLAIEIMRVSTADSRIDGRNDWTGQCHFVREAETE